MIKTCSIGLVLQMSPVALKAIVGAANNRNRQVLRVWIIRLKQTLLNTYLQNGLYDLPMAQ